MMENDLVSIITPAYNSEKYIGETIESVLSQTYTNFELIIINDFSNDRTLEISKNYANKDQRIKIIDLKINGGAANAWNEAFKIMQGRYISFIDSDDLWVPEKLEIQLNFMKENNYGFTYGQYKWINCNSELMNKKIDIPDSINYKRMLIKNDIGLLTVMLDRDKINIKSVPIVKMAWDYLLWVEIMKDDIVAYGVTKTLGYYRILPYSASRNKKKAARGIWELYKIHFHFSLVKRIFYFIRYAMISLKRYYID